MGLFDNLTGMLGGGPSGSEEGSQGGGAMGMFSQLLNQDGGPSSNILGSLLGGGQQTQGAAPQDSAGQAPAAGGLAGMLETLAANGLGEHVSSWLSNNPNLPINPQQIHDALGSQQVRQMAASSGLPVGAFLQQLAQHLPQAASEQAGVNPG
ncbi:YidB family protein [Caulobacter sp. S45]|uniref:YidB family protein n=1 Tax=Caulobacter sp. S45 TaxID=1641861 RepID=UPI001576DA48|nr:YidB family protein [Caulobacter sp. S45]